MIYKPYRCSPNIIEMKNYLLLFLLAITSLAYGQSTLIHKPDHKSGAYFIDSIRVNALTMNYINPNDIKDVYLSQNFFDKETNLRGALYITTNNVKAYNLINLDEIKKARGIAVTGAAIYMVDNQFIKDTQYFKLPSSCIHHITVTKGTEFDSLKSDLPNLSIVNIITKDNVPKSKGLMIRGTTEK